MQEAVPSRSLAEEKGKQPLGDFDKMPPIEAPVISQNTAMANQEYGLSSEQQKTLEGGCIWNAIAGPEGLTRSQKDALKSELDTLQANLATSIDLIRRRRSGVSSQIGRLDEEIQAIGKGNENAQRFHALAQKAIQNCSEAAIAAQDAKSGIDLIFSRGTELAYRRSVLGSLDAELAEQEQRLRASMSKLDEIGAATS